MDTSELLRHMERIERTNQPLKVGVCLLGLALVSLCVMAAAPQEQCFKAIKTESLQLVDDNGNARCKVGTDGLHLYYETGKLRCRVTSTEDASSLYLRDENSKLRGMPSGRA
jgi:hypothetical protein